MNELERMIQQLGLENDPRLGALQQFMNTGKSFRVSPQTSSRIMQAAQAAQQGDQATAKQIMLDILATPEGSALAAQLRTLLGQ